MQAALHCCHYQVALLLKMPVICQGRDVWLTMTCLAA